MRVVIAGVQTGGREGDARPVALVGQVESVTYTPGQRPGD